MISKYIKHVLLLGYIVLLNTNITAQQISNVHFEQVGKKINIYYDLYASGSSTFNIKLFCSIDDGETWGIPLKQVSGHVGSNQYSGRNKKIVWDVLKERDRLTSDVEFKLEAKVEDDGKEVSYTTYVNPQYHFSFKYHDQIKAISEAQMEDINSMFHNQELNVSYEAGFTRDESTLQPLILVYVQKRNHPTSFYSAVSSITTDEIDLSGPVSTINDIIPLISKASTDKPVVDFENKTILMTGEATYDFFGLETDMKILMAMFFGNEKIIQLNFVSQVDEFESNLNEYFLPIIKSFEFDQGFQFVEGKIKEQSAFNIPGKDFLAGYSSKYVCDGSGKGLGLRFSIKYPQSWKSEEGNRPHIVRKFYPDDMRAQVMILVNDFEYIPSESEIDDFFTTESAKQMIPIGGNYIKSNTTVIEGEKALVIDYTVKRERLGTTFTGNHRMYSIIYKSYLLQVLFNVSQSPHEEPIILNKEFEKHEMLFNAMINSLSLISKWEDY